MCKRRENSIIVIGVVSITQAETVGCQGGAIPPFPQDIGDAANKELMG